MTYSNSGKTSNRLSHYNDSTLAFTGAVPHSKCNSGESSSSSIRVGLFRYISGELSRSVSSMAGAPSFLHFRPSIRKTPSTPSISSLYNNGRFKTFPSRATHLLWQNGAPPSLLSSSQQDLLHLGSKSTESGQILILIAVVSYAIRNCTSNKFWKNHEVYKIRKFKIYQLQRDSLPKVNSFGNRLMRFIWARYHHGRERSSNVQMPNTWLLDNMHGHMVQVVAG
ncbi:hypothetical protein KSP40_PGU001078 [Platanthera guangdongensis]|uniref:Uncharacterized protein n=1 Tax=Platanthera guangdongensis TaxID=2320717 RepID=A0ABR2LE51_9ASPA